MTRSRPDSPPSRVPARPLAALALAAALLSPATAPAATVLPLDLDALDAAADAVVRGVVLSSVPRLAPTGRIVTDVRLRVDETLRGTSDEEAWVATPGGEIGDEGQRVPGAPVLEPGDEVVLFLSRPGPPSRLSRCVVVGLSRGLLRVDRPAAGPPRLRQDTSGLRLLGPDAGDLPDTLEGLRDALRALPRREAP